MRQLLEAGAHFGHQAHRWNPKMSTYIFGTRNNIHIIDLAQTVPMLHRALQAVSDTVAKGGRVLFVGTKRQASDAVAEAAKRSAQYYVNSRWLGGMLTNWKTISGSISRLRTLDETLSVGGPGLTKKERLMLSREKEKLEKALGGIKDMGGVPDLLFVIDTNKEQLAIKEAGRLGIPVAAIVDTNCDPDGIAYPVPANDDAGRAIALYCDLIARAAVDGIGRSLRGGGVRHPDRDGPGISGRLGAQQDVALGKRDGRWEVCGHGAERELELSPGRLADALIDEILGEAAPRECDGERERRGCRRGTAQRQPRAHQTLAF